MNDHHGASRIGESDAPSGIEEISIHVSGDVTSEVTTYCGKKWEACNKLQGVGDLYNNVKIRK